MKEELDYVVENNSKKQLAYSEDGLQIRASQGHSIKIDLGYEAVAPPEFLFHGTATRFLESIKETGLDKQNRHHVHLSSNQETANSVGKRYGKLALLIIKSKEIQEAGHEFFVSENQVWLTDNVPIEFIQFV